MSWLYIISDAFNMIWGELMIHSLAGVPIGYILLGLFVLNITITVIFRGLTK
jgi:hypothetical protein